MKKFFLQVLLILSCLLMVACSAYDENGYQKIKNGNYVSNQSDDANVKNIILIIGDGMGENHVKLSKLMVYNNEDVLDLDKAEYRSMMETSCLNNYVTDSAAAATAMATGVKTNYERVGMDESGNELTTILDVAHNAGMATGVVTDQTLYDATPAGFTAHALNRYNGRNDIIQGQIAGNIDVLIGLGAANYFKYAEQITNNGWEYIDQTKSFEKSKSDRIFATFNETASDILPLYELADKAINILSKNDNGFFLMIEAGSIDDEADSGNCQGVADEVAILDKTLRVALNFMRSNDETIVVVLADHETGGLVIGEGEPNKDWFTEPTRYHTPADVPVYAFGTKSKVFDNKSLKNTDIYNIFIELLKLSQ